MTTAVKIPCPYCFALVTIQTPDGASTWAHERTVCEQFRTEARPDTLRRMRRQVAIAVKAIEKAGPS